MHESPGFSEQRMTKRSYFTAKQSNETNGSAASSSRAKDLILGINYVSHRVKILFKCKKEDYVLLSKRLSNKGQDKLSASEKISFRKNINLFSTVYT